jgi:hypothetical protein
VPAIERASLRSSSLDTGPGQCAPDYEDHDSGAICTSSAYEFRVVAHWTLPSTERQAIKATGFSLEETLVYDGDAVIDDSTTTPYFCALARKNGHR